MGSRYVDAVLFGLEGREFSLPWGKSGKDKKFGAQDMAFLLTVAARQPNPTTKRHGGLDPVCYGSPESMRSQMHLKKSAFLPLTIMSVTPSPSQSQKQNLRRPAAPKSPYVILIGEPSA